MVVSNDGVRASSSATRQIPPRELCSHLRIARLGPVWLKLLSIWLSRLLSACRDLLPRVSDRIKSSFLPSERRMARMAQITEIGIECIGVYSASEHA